MRALFGTIAIAAALCFAGLSGASAALNNGTVSQAAAAPAKATVVAQRCRCVERRWNGSCKLRVCRDRW